MTEYRRVWYAAGLAASEALLVQMQSSAAARRQQMAILDGVLGKAPPMPRGQALEEHFLLTSGALKSEMSTYDSAKAAESILLYFVMGSRAGLSGFQSPFTLSPMMGGPPTFGESGPSGVQNKNPFAVR